MTGPMLMVLVGCAMAGAIVLIDAWLRRKERDR